MQNILCVGLGGFIGASLRYIISLHSSKILGTQLPYGTLIVNVLGGFLIGVIMELSIKNNMMSQSLKLFLTTGIMGGLTTFSTFSYETVALFSGGSYILGMINAGLNLFLSISGVLLGKLVTQFM